MKTKRNFFNSHLIDSNISYLRHMRRALLFFVKTSIASFAFLIHGIFPFLLKKLGSDITKSLNVDIENFNRTINRRIRSGAVAIVLNDEGKAFIMKRSDKVGTFRGYWNFPSGGVDPGESPIEAAARECSEESGIEISVSDMAFVTSFTDYNLDVDIYYFVTKKYSGTPSINWESTEFMWSDIDDALNDSFVPVPKNLSNLIKEKASTL